MSAVSARVEVSAPLCDRNLRKKHLKKASAQYVETRILKVIFFSLPSMCLVFLPHGIYPALIEKSSSMSIIHHAPPVHCIGSRQIDKQPWQKTLRAGESCLSKGLDLSRTHRTPTTRPKHVPLSEHPVAGGLVQNSGIRI